jgi:hypothetical protein
MASEVMANKMTPMPQKSAVTSDECSPTARSIFLVMIDIGIFA